MNFGDPGGLQEHWVGDGLYDVIGNTCDDIRNVGYDVGLAFYANGNRVCTLDAIIENRSNLTSIQVSALNLGFHYAFDLATENLGCLS